MLLCGSFALHLRAADRGCDVSTRPSLRPLGQEGGVTRQSSGEMRREGEKTCLRGRRMGRALAKPIMLWRSGCVMGFASLYPSYECMSENCSVASYLSLRAQRSNPESLRGKTLDCFAALAMTMGKRLATNSGIVGWAKRSVPTTLRIVTGTWARRSAPLPTLRHCAASLAPPATSATRPREISRRPAARATQLRVRPSPPQIRVCSTCRKISSCSLSSSRRYRGSFPRVFPVTIVLSSQHSQWI